MIPAPTVTGWSTFWQQIAPVGQGAAYALHGNRSSQERRIAIHLAKPGYRGMRRVIRTLLGAAVGAAATETHSRIVAPAGLTQAASFGGARQIESVTDVNRVTTAADLTYVQGVVDRVYNANPTSYPTDLSGNGGGGKEGV